jgi:hypothetical protein
MNHHNVNAMILFSIAGNFIVSVGWHLSVKAAEWRTAPRQADYRHLASATEDFVSITREANRKPANSSIVPQSKVVFVCRNSGFESGREGGQIDPLTASLSDVHLPQSIGEVGTVVALYWNAELVGQYKNGTSAWRRTCLVKVVDSRTRTIIAQRDFVGGEPPEKLYRRSYTKDVFGSGCSKEILAYIESLFPTKPQH